MEEKEKKLNQCSPKTCGDCNFYKYYSRCGFGCHLTPETGIIREGPITKDCPYKVKLTNEEKIIRARQRKFLMSEG